MACTAYLMVPSVSLVCFLQRVKTQMEHDNESIKLMKINEKNEKEQAEVDKWVHLEATLTQLTTRLDRLEQEHHGTQALQTPPNDLKHLRQLIEQAKKQTLDGRNLPKRPDDIQSLIESWLKSMPTPKEMADLHPLSWSEQDQEVLQSSTTTKVYRLLDDLEEDAQWLTENVFSTDREKFPGDPG